ncbi:hypothetical protein ACQP1P_46935 [Dactylosporangium sp. CA-052675]|uniref:hypothetical protein n=1 Tax=Dactylosporangium sp. CA-052675 TaxID=3239927 RepID=UPI003D93947C
MARRAPPALAPGGGDRGAARRVRPDGTEILLDVASSAAGSSATVPFISEEQAIRLATAPEMTLYPTVP